MIRIVLIVLFTQSIYLGTGNAQVSSERDSLAYVFEHGKVPNERFTAAKKLAKLTFQNNPEQTIRIVENAINLLDSLYQSHIFSDSIALDFRITYLHYKAVALGNLGAVDAQIKTAMERLRIVQQHGLRTHESSALSAIGNIYLNLGHHDEAREYFQRTMAIDEALADTLGVGIDLGNIVSTMGYAQPDTNLKYYRRSLALILSTRQPERDATAAWMMQNIADVYEHINNLDSALNYIERSLAIRRKIDHRLGQFHALICLASIRMKQGRLDSALKSINEAIFISVSNGFQDNYGCYELRSEILAAKGQYAAALDDHIRFVHLRDSIVNEDNTKELVQHTMRYEYSRKLLTDSLEYTKREAVLEERSEKQRIGLAAIAGVLLLLCALVLAIFRGKKRSDALLLNILPEETARELKKKGNAESKLIEQVTVLFTDFKGFTALSEKLSPKELVHDLNECFSAFDLIMEKYGIEKIKTIGDAYMAAGGLPTPNSTHAVDVIMAALEMRDFVEKCKKNKVRQGQPYFEIRIGVHTGPVVAGIVGIKKFQYDIWGDTVNTANRMESSGEVGKVNISETTHELVKDRFSFTERGEIEAKDKGRLKMYFVEAVL